jgi:hypothetical protein
MHTLSQNNLFIKVLNKVLSEFGITIIQKELYGIIKRLEDDYGYRFTRQLGKPIDTSQNPIPWFTYPAIEFISQLDLTDKSIFEWGSGNSSLFFAKRAASIISVESNCNWYNYISQNLSTNQNLILRREEEFAEAIEEFPNKYDVIVVDAHRRYDCAEKALNFLNDGGFIILDNSDWYPNTSSMLRNIGGLIDIDMHGFGPINEYSWTTSFYFHRNFNFKPIEGIQPHLSRSGIKQQAKDDYSSYKLTLGFQDV